MSLTLTKCVGLAIVTGPEVTITLPANPRHGQSVRIAAAALEGDVTVNGNGNEILDGGKLIPGESSHLLVFVSDSGKCGGSSPGKWVANTGSTSVSQADWYINAVSGSNANSGKTPALALKTYAEFQRRIGNFTVVTPTGGKLTINILTDLPDSDPVTFRNLLAAGATAVIKGKEVVKRSGTCSPGTSDKTPSTPAANGGTPNIVQDAMLPNVNSWAAFEGLVLKTANGARAIVGLNLGAKRAQVSTWLENDTVVGDINGFMVLASTTPGNNTPYQVLDYSKVVLGDMFVGANFSKAVTNVAGAPVCGGLLLEDLHVKAATSPDGSELLVTSPRVLGSIETVTSFRNCIVDPEFDSAPEAGNMIIANCSFRGGVFVNGSPFVAVIGSLWRPKPGVFDGGMIIQPGSDVFFVGDPMFIGDIANGSDADVRVRGHLNKGPVSFWNTTHAFVIDQGAQVVDVGQTVLGEQGYVAFWGDCSMGQQLIIYPGGKLDVTQATDASAPILPTLIMATGLGGATTTLAVDQSDGAAPDGDLAHAWQHLGAVPSPTALSFTNGRPTSWANFATLISAGGFVDQPNPTPLPNPPGFVINYANAINPGNSAGMTFTYIYKP